MPAIACDFLRGEIETVSSARKRIEDVGHDLTQRGIESRRATEAKAIGDLLIKLPWPRSETLWTIHPSEHIDLGESLIPIKTPRYAHTRHERKALSIVIAAIKSVKFLFCLRPPPTKEIVLFKVLFGIVLYGIRITPNRSSLEDFVTNRCVRFAPRVITREKATSKNRQKTGDAYERQQSLPFHVGTCKTRSAAYYWGRRRTLPSLAYLSKHQAAIVPAEAEAVGDGPAHSGLPRLVGHVVEVAVGIGRE